ncbi:MAG: phosphomannomutase/phosphoglucomutase [Patescibacteria group bacterium]
MKINRHIFRGYDLRGLVDKDLNEEIVEHIGKAFGTYLVKRGINKVIVGYDCRETSPKYSEALTRGIISTGVDVIKIGMTMIGTFYWSQYYLKCKGGVFVTASHNPPEYNGFKFANDFSETLVSDGMQELKNLVETENYIKLNKKGEVEEKNIREAYFDDLIKRFNIKKKFKVLVDPSNGTAAIIVPDLLRRFGCEVIEKNCEIDSTFPLGTPDPTEKAVVSRVAREVVESKADIGFTYDADADRIGIVDEKGGIIWNDVLLALFASDVLDHHSGAKIMYNTLCSKVVEDTILQKGGKPFMWRTGHSFLKKKNQEVKAAFIGELSGHFFFSADFYNHDDGCYSTLRLLDYLSRTNQKLSEAINALPKYISSPEIKLFCADDKKVVLIEKISPILKKDFPQAQVIDDERAGDGVRLDMKDAMFVIRYSQNGPYLTIKFEAKTQEKYEDLKKYIRELLHKFEEIDWNSKINVNLEAIE